MSGNVLPDKIWHQEFGKWVSLKNIINREIINNFFGKEVGKIYSTTYGYGPNSSNYRMCFISAERFKLLEYPNIFVYELKVFLIEEFFQYKEHVIKHSIFFETDQKVVGHLINDFILEA